MNITPLFALPLELREQIYKDVLMSPAQGPELLQTCREVKAEAHKLYYERPIAFGDQLELYNWIDHTASQDHVYVTDLSISIKDIDCRKGLDPNALINHPDAPPRLRIPDLYEAELTRLKQALQKLYNVRNITIKALPKSQSYLYRNFLAKAFDVLSALYPNLTDLRLEGDLQHQSLTFMTSFKHLQCFTFDGFSGSSATETADVLAQLEHLQHLCFISRKAVSSHAYSIPTGKQHSFTGDVMRTMNRLASFSVVDFIPASSPSYCTSEIISALHNNKKLRSLSLTLLQAPDVETLTALESFLEKVTIERLELDWPDLTPEVLEEYVLVESVKIFWVRARSAADVAEILCSLWESRRDGEISALSRVVLVRASKSYGKPDVTVCNRKDSGADTEVFSPDLVSIRFSS